MEKVLVKNIIPDENQPRRYFDASKMKTLESSIKQQGIISPLTLQDLGNGKYIILDGERRFRTAVAMGLKEVPAVIEPLTTDTDRLVRQFNIQEMHESWSPLEKAIALENLSKALNLPLVEVGKLINATRAELARYSAFVQIADKANYIKNEIPLDHAMGFNAIRNHIKRISEGELKKEFSTSDIRKVERTLVTMVKDGRFENRNHVTRIKDAITKNPKLIQKLIEGDKNMTATSMFLDSGAQTAYTLRNVINNAGFMSGHIHKFLKTGGKSDDINPRDKNVLISAYRALEELMSVIK